MFTRRGLPRSIFLSHVFRYPAAKPHTISTPLANPASFRASHSQHKTRLESSNGDLNNLSAVRPVAEYAVDAAFVRRSLAILESDDDPEIRRQYRSFLLPEEIANSDWIANLEISTAMKMANDEMYRVDGSRLKVLVLYGSLRERSYSKLLAFEAARILFRLGCDVRIFNPAGLPVKDDSQHSHPKVQELRDLSRWSDGHVWISPEQHGNVTAVFKNQIDWVPLSTGSSFNTVNTLRILGRWMRMFTIPNQSSIPMAYNQFTDAEDTTDGGSRLKPSGNRDRLVDCMEEFVKYSIVMRPYFDLFSDRYSERTEKLAKQAKSMEMSGASLYIWFD